MNEQYQKEDALAVLRIIASGDYRTQRELASLLGMSLGKINYLLKLLIARELVTTQVFYQENLKLRKTRYAITEKGLREKTALTRHFLEQKEREYFMLKKEADLALISESGKEPHGA